jgi:pimeloyl-ACP methyl ester carboxylesterase
MPALTLGGNVLNYEVVGEGPPLIYIAGTRFDSAKQWAPYMKEHATGFRVILPDPRGLAGSVHVSSIEPRDWVDDLGALLDGLDIRRVNLAAETLGTRIATRFAADHPGRVATLILNGTIAYSSPAGDAQRRGNADASGQERAAAAAASLPEERQRSMEHHHGADWPAVNDFYLELHARPDFHEYFDLRKVAARVQAPTLLVRGDIDDPVHPVIHSVELHDLLPKSWLAIYPNTEFNALRARPKEAWDLIRRFVGEQG